MQKMVLSPMTKGLTLETSASLSLCGENLTLINLLTQNLEFHLSTDAASKKTESNLTIVWLIHYRRKGEKDFRRNSLKTLLPLPLNPFFNNLSEDVIT